ncbi:hypothetical protein [Paraburkholderia kirstenboschensis]|uniref:hypothetical protein n=1 Tax=Paraburkholderia kirstenboschensis TaxID=1245436 RepID=UPI001FB46FC2|nr:hypothetical protein [Paraburkholderia kirstenboschensis]
MPNPLLLQCSYRPTGYVHLINTLGALIVMDLVEFSSLRVNEKLDYSQPSKHIGLLVSQNFFTATAGAIGDAFRLANAAELARGKQAPYRLTVLSDQGASSPAPAASRLARNNLTITASATFMRSSWRAATRR